MSFVHVAVTDGDGNPLTSSPAFAAFQADIGERCAEGPTPAEATVIGNFGVAGITLPPAGRRVAAPPASLL